MNIHTLTYIDQYLNNELSPIEADIFEKRLRADVEFKSNYENQLNLIEGMRRVELKAEIKKAMTTYFRNRNLLKGFGIILIIILSSIIYLWLNQKSPQPFHLFKDSEKQTIKVPFEENMTIKGKKGVVIHINSKDLLCESCETETNIDSITVILKELTTRKDLILENVQTVSNGKWLKSGGSYFIDLYHNNNHLSLKEGKSIKVDFPVNTNQENMSLFYGERLEDGRINWNKTNKKLEEKTYTLLVYRDSTVIDKVLSKYFGLDMMRTKFYQKDINYYKLSELKKLIFMDSIINIKNQDISLSSSKALIIQNDTLRLHYGDIPKQKQDEYIIEEFYEGPMFLTKKRVLEINNFNSEELILDLQQSYETFDLFYEQIEISKLGWINIDKFYGETDLVKLNIKTPVNYDYQDIYLVDSIDNTLISTAGYEIKIPRNKEFYIIGIANKNGETFGLKRKVKINADKTLNLEFKKMNKSNIKSLLKF